MCRIDRIIMKIFSFTTTGEYSSPLIFYRSSYVNLLADMQNSYEWKYMWFNFEILKIYDASVFLTNFHIFPLTHDRCTLRRWAFPLTAERVRGNLENGRGKGRNLWLFFNEKCNLLRCSNGKRLPIRQQKLDDWNENSERDEKWPLSPRTNEVFNFRRFVYTLYDFFVTFYFFALSAFNFRNSNFILVWVRGGRIQIERARQAENVGDRGHFYYSHLKNELFVKKSDENMSHMRRQMFWIGRHGKFERFPFISKRALFIRSIKIRIILVIAWNWNSSKFKHFLL